MPAGLPVNMAAGVPLALLMLAAVADAVKLHIRGGSAGPDTAVDVPPDGIPDPADGTTDPGTKVPKGLARVNGSSIVVGSAGGCTAAYTARAPKGYQDCRGTKACCTRGMTCFEKDSNFAACLWSCQPGIHRDEPREMRYPWSCRVLRDAPPPPPPPAPVPLDQPSNAPLYTFYMYRAMSDTTFPLQNVNAANLAGVLWYLNNEVVIKTPRKFGITRIVRLKVQTKGTGVLASKGMNFGVRYAFDSGQCTGPYSCDEAFKKYGYFVGCNNLGDFPFPLTPTHYPGAIWYSLPGPCPSRKYSEQDEGCKKSEPGGWCPGPPTGQGNCTYSYELAGEITLGELEGNMGQGFWNNIDSDSDCQRRLAAARAAFTTKYPASALDTDLPSPSCDFNREKFYS